MDMDISMDIHAKSVGADIDMDGKFHIHGNPGQWAFLDTYLLSSFLDHPIIIIVFIENCQNAS